MLRICHRLVTVLGVVLCGLTLSQSLARAETRLALVIGNSAYQHTSVLPNPANDARLMADRLTALGFSVVGGVQTDLDDRAMKRAIRDFTSALREAGRDAVGLVFYAGHGLQVGGANYLVPVNAQIEKEGDVAIETIDAGAMMAGLADAGNRLNIIVLDACRDNPYKGFSRSAARGLARMDAPTGSLIAFSTAPGQVAADGEGGNSPFTAALADVIATPGLKIEDVFKRTRERVYEKTAKKQVPWETSSIFGDFYFRRFDDWDMISATPAKPVITPPIQTDDRLIGIWRGQVVERGRAPYDMELRVTNPQQALTSYPSFPCRGALVRVQGPGLVFRETIVENAKLCASGGVINLVPSDDEMVFLWADAEGATPRAQGLLKRVVEAQADPCKGPNPPLNCLFGGK